MPLTVLEIGAGPTAAAAAGYAGKLFRRWGADVIRVEDPNAQSHDHRAEHTAVDLYLHAGKQRVALDFHSADGRGLLDRLAAKADVLITDLPAAELEALDWSTLGGSALHTRAAITPFGLDGPKRNWQATSSVLLAMGGQTYLMGDPGRAPLTMPGRYLYYQSGQYAYAAALGTGPAADSEFWPTRTPSSRLASYSTSWACRPTWLEGRTRLLLKKYISALTPAPTRAGMP